MSWPNRIIKVLDHVEVALKEGWKAWGSFPILLQMFLLGNLVLALLPYLGLAYVTGLFMLHYKKKG